MLKLVKKNCDSWAWQCKFYTLHPQMCNSNFIQQYIDLNTESQNRENIFKICWQLRGKESVCFSLNGDTLSSGSNDKTIYLWDIKTRQQKSKLNGHKREVNSRCFPPDGTEFASGRNDRYIRLWDVKTGKQQAKLAGPYSEVNSICFSPDSITQNLVVNATLFFVIKLQAEYKQN